MSQKRILPAFLLCFFAGPLGLHRFYVGKAKSGVIHLLTLGGFGIWSLIDLVKIVIGSFTDANNRAITQWT